MIIHHLANASVIQENLIHIVFICVFLIRRRCVLLTILRKCKIQCLSTQNCSARADSVSSLEIRSFRFRDASICIWINLFMEEMLFWVCDFAYCVEMNAEINLLATEFFFKF